MRPNGTSIDRKGSPPFFFVCFFPRIARFEGKKGVFRMVFIFSLLLPILFYRPESFEGQIVLIHGKFPNQKIDIYILVYKSLLSNRRLLDI